MSFLTYHDTQSEVRPLTSQVRVGHQRNEMAWFKPRVLILVRHGLLLRFCFGALQITMSCRTRRGQVTADIQELLRFR